MLPSVTWLIVLAMLIVAVPSSASTPPCASGCAEPVLTLVGELPQLGVMRRTHLVVRITNGRDPIPAFDAEAYRRGQPRIDVGAWFAETRPSVVGPLQRQIVIDRALRPGESIDVALVVIPPRAGTQFLAFGLWQSTIDGRGNRQVGDVLAISVNVAAGPWYDTHEPSLVRALVRFHAVGFAAALVAALVLAYVRRAGSGRSAA